MKKETKKLPKAFKAKWVKALRSGKYKQTNNELYDGIGYCCLGVAGVECGIPKRILKGNGLYLEGQGSTEKYAIKYKLPKMLIGDCANSEDFNPLVDKLTNFNDNKNWSFKKIAAYIDRYL